MNQERSRFNLALDFACAAVSVLLSGRVADRLVEQQSSGAEPQSSGAGIPAALAHIPQSEFRRGGKYCGVLTRVANAHGVSRPALHDLSRGNQRNRRLLDAVIAEIAIIDENYEQPPRPLTAEERCEFWRGGRYYGVYSRVARSLGKHPRHVAKKKHSCTVLRAIREEMARVDATLANGQVRP